jgi:hypothetical protein
MVFLYTKLYNKKVKTWLQLNTTASYNIRMQLQYKMIKHGMKEEIIFIVLGGEAERGCNLCPANMLQRKNVEERTMFIGWVSCFLFPSSTVVTTRNVQRCIWESITLRDLQSSKQIFALLVPPDSGWAVRRRRRLHDIVQEALYGVTWCLQNALRHPVNLLNAPITACK